MRVVLDTNVLLSGMLTRGLCEAVLDACVDSPDVEMVLSDHILREFERHASRKFGVPDNEAKEAVEFLRRWSTIVQPANLPADACKDPDDVPVLGTAVAAHAAVLVTGDAELLALEQIGDVAIVSPREFYERLR